MSAKKTNFQQIFNRSIKTDAYEDIWLDNSPVLILNHSRRTKSYKVPKFKKRDQFRW